MPKIAYPSVPFLGVQGFLVTKYADNPRRRVARTGLRRELHLDSVGAGRTRERERSLAANSKAGASFSDPVLAQFGKAGKGGVPMPNIPQMGSVWTDLGQAWVRSTKGAGAAKAAASFTAAARAIADKIG